MLERVILMLGLVVLFYIWSRTKELPVHRLAAEVINNGNKRGVLLWSLVGLVTVLQITGLVEIFPIRASPGVHTVCRLLGSTLYLAGVGLASWAKATLGPNWDPLTEDRPLVTTGPYRLLPHPIYMGGYLAAAGAQLALGSWLVLLVIPGIPVILHVIRKEEWLLIVEFGEKYQLYKGSTWLYRFLIWLDRWISTT